MSKFRKPVFGATKSPTRKLVDPMSVDETQRMMVEIMGEDRPWTTSWDAAHEAAESKGVLSFPRYYGRTRLGKWSVKEHHGFPLSNEDTGPMAICKAILILEIGKGKGYSPLAKRETKDDDAQTDAGHGRGGGRLDGSNGQTVSRNITIKVSEPPRRPSMGHIKPV